MRGLRIVRNYSIENFHLSPEYPLQLGSKGRASLHGSIGRRRNGSTGLVIRHRSDAIGLNKELDIESQEGASLPLGRSSRVRCVISYMIFSQPIGMSAFGSDLNEVRRHCDD
jgi:hypothetical protein